MKPIIFDLVVIWYTYGVPILIITAYFILVAIGAFILRVIKEIKKQK
jgi:hypothetical protein